MAAMYIGEGDVWKCPKHPSKRHRTGVCPVCLRDRLIVLCPECANTLPCLLCNASGSSSSNSSASSSSSFSLFSSSSSGGGGGGGRVSELIDREPAFGRSRSVGIPYIFSRFAGEKLGVNQRPEPAIRSKSKIALFLSKFKSMIQIRKRGEIEKNDSDSQHRLDSSTSKHSSKRASVDDFARVMLKSRSVHLPTAAAATSHYAKSPATVKNRRSFQSPMRFSRQCITKASTAATTQAVNLDSMQHY